MATITIDLEPGETIDIVASTYADVFEDFEPEEDPDPGEEAPTEEAQPLIRAVGGKK